MAREKTKTKVATIKLTPECRRAWEAAAASERRSLAHMFEVAILEYRQRHRVEISPESAAAAVVPARTARRAATR
jgi:hypothetical protein